MGTRALAQEAATAEDIAAMRALLTMVALVIMLTAIIGSALVVTTDKFVCERVVSADNLRLAR